MTDPTDNAPELEDRLRRALASRAASVEPRIGGADPAGLAERAAAARRQAVRRRMVLSAAAVVAVVALAAGAFVLWPDSDDETDVATGGGDTTTTVPGEPGSVGDGIIWPLPTMSLAYETPEDAASAFMTEYLRLDASCAPPRDVVAGRADVPCVPPCDDTVGGDEAGALCELSTTTVSTSRLGDARWGVTQADTARFAAEALLDGTLVVAEITATPEPLPSPYAIELRPVGSMEVTGEPASGLRDLMLPGRSDRIELVDVASVQGPHVLVVVAGTAASATIFDPAELLPAPTTTTTTEPATDDDVRGWPGPVARVFDDPEAAAQSFVQEVLELADPALADATGDDTDMIFEYHPRPTAGISTVITVHHTGNVRGWVVTGLASRNGTIDEASLDGTTVTVTGSAQAFEAQVSILVLDEQGNVLGESFTMAGGTEVLPYEGTVEFDPSLGTPFWVLIAEGDASGEGRFTWATTANL